VTGPIITLPVNRLAGGYIFHCHLALVEIVSPIMAAHAQLPMLSVAISVSIANDNGLPSMPSVALWFVDYYSVTDIHCLPPKK
jgi:hypothetical protein